MQKNNKICKALGRYPDHVIGEDSNPYLLRWYVIPKNRWFNVYLHKFMRSDDDRALHDHPWWNLSILLSGRYFEIMPVDRAGFADGSNRDLTQKLRKPFRVVFRPALAAHRIKLLQHFRHGELPVWSLFITGPRIREWGFYCDHGWRHFAEFVSVRPGGNAIGKGCD